MGQDLRSLTVNIDPTAPLVSKPTWGADFRIEVDPQTKRYLAINKKNGETFDAWTRKPVLNQNAPPTEHGVLDYEVNPNVPTLAGMSLTPNNLVKAYLKEGPVRAAEGLGEMVEGGGVPSANKALTGAFTAMAPLVGPSLWTTTPVQLAKMAGASYLGANTLKNVGKASGASPETQQLLENIGSFADPSHLGLAGKATLAGLALGRVENVGGTFPKLTRETLTQLAKELPEKVYQKLTGAISLTPSSRRYMSFLTPAEVASLSGPRSADRVAEFARIREGLPPVETLIGAALGGAEKRGWYESSRAALSHMFGQDADLFAGLLAATSPQNSVEMNLQNATRVYAAWNRAGRPTDRNTILKIMGDSVLGTKGEKSVLDAWKNNTVSVLQGGNIISGPKVDSFWTNLRNRVRVTPHGDVNPEDAVTLDAWMANVFGIDNKYFAGQGTKNKLKAGDPGYSPGYLAGSSLVREAAAKLGISPAEAQETIWSFGKALYEKSEATGMTAREILEQGLLSPAEIAGTPDFEVLLRDPQYSGVLKDLHPDMPMRIATLEPSVRRDMPDLNAQNTKWMLDAADALDDLKSMRELSSRYRTGTQAPGTVMASLPLEAKPGLRTGVDVGVWDKSQKAQDLRSGQILDSLEDLRGRNVLAESVFPGRTAPTRVGRGWYQNEEGQVEHNALRTTPVEVRESGGRIHPKDEGTLRFVHALQSAMTGQAQAIHSAVKFKTPEGFDAMRISTPRAVSSHDFGTLSSRMPPGPYALIHKSDGIDVIKFDGTEMTKADLDEISKHILSYVKPASDTKLTPKVMTGKNVVDTSSNFQVLPWGSEGSRDVTRYTLNDLPSLTKAQRRAIDRDVKQPAAEMLKVYEANPKSRKDHLNFLRILAKDGVTGLEKALGDPSQILPVLAALGLGSSLARTSQSGRDVK